MAAIRPVMVLPAVVIVGYFALDIAFKLMALVQKNTGIFLKCVNAAMISAAKFDEIRTRIL